ncbi:MAG TPA: TIGR04283 family arsenosugar biosynthesis glycosyltransferase [Longimicrobiales bacterium]|nr:TIGR04283 family arsenosugar biosynthesis glycosyltransferase [Longimicrobiales bacterium]
MSRLDFTIVIPALDEEARIERTLAAARAAFGDRAEYIVADGGSADATVARSRAAGARVLHARGGRGAQLAAGAAMAAAPAIVFLHADTLVPPDAAAVLATALADPRVVGGAFRLRFDPAERPTAAQRLLARGIGFRSRAFRTATGDQAIFARAATLAAVGGVPAVPLFEDVRLYRALRRAGRVRLLDAAVTTSPRLWRTRGTLRVVLLHLAFRALHAAGVSPARLAAWYYRPRASLRPTAARSTR